MKRAMSIGGSDSGGGAGVQADLKTFSAYGVHGTIAITAVTAQNTRGVQEILPLPPDTIRSQIGSIMEDIGTDAVKTGLLPTPEIVEVVSQCVREFTIRHLIIDPIMLAHSGEILASREATLRLRDTLLPLCFLVTPNIPEAESITGLKIDKPNDMEKAAQAIHDLGARSVLIKGGHFEGDNIGCDLFSEGKGPTFLRTGLVSRWETHGTGCVFSAAIAAGLAKGIPLIRSIEAAKEFVTRSIASAYSLGDGARTINPLRFGIDTKE